MTWSDIIGMRHRLVHAYFEINLDILWKTILEGLPPLVTELTKVISAEDAARLSEDTDDE